MVLKVKLKELRENHPDSPSQRALGDFLGIAEGNYRRLENGYAKSIAFETIDKLCSFFNCTPCDILEYSNGQESKGGDRKRQKAKERDDD